QFSRGLAPQSSPGTGKVVRTQFGHEEYGIELAIILGFFVKSAVKEDELALVANKENPGLVPEVAVIDVRPPAHGFTPFKVECRRSVDAAIPGSAADRKTR